MKRIKEFENWMDDPSSIEYRRGIKLNQENDEETNGFDLDFKSNDPEELDNEMELLIAKFGIGKVRNWIENYLR